MVLVEFARCRPARAAPSCRDRDRAGSGCARDACSRDTGPGRACTGNAGARDARSGQLIPDDFLSKGAASVAPFFFGATFTPRLIRGGVRSI